MSNARLALLAFALLAPSTAFAQAISSPLRYVEETQSLGAFAGYLLTDRGELDLGPHSAPLFGANYTIRFAGPLSGEVSLGGAPSRRTVYAQAPGDSVPQERGEVSAFLLLAEAALKFHLTGPRTWHGLAPYGVGGVGLVGDLAGSTALEDEINETQRFDFGPGFAVSLAAGTDWVPSERLAFRIEVRDRLWRLTTPTGLTATGREEAAWTNNFAITLGAALLF